MKRILCVGRRLEGAWIGDVALGETWPGNTSIGRIPSPFALVQCATPGLLISYADREYTRI